MLDGLGIGGAEEATAFPTAQNNVGGTFGIIGTTPGFNTASSFNKGQGQATETRTGEL